MQKRILKNKYGLVVFAYSKGIRLDRRVFYLRILRIKCTTVERGLNTFLYENVLQTEKLNDW